mmetsp:Transcript_20403/g.51050  ORF Transcript_20403/g.51050 Transcript_20403/m.51050 type:complete len:426 (+) Transcript_20403:22-1299(+)
MPLSDDEISAALDQVENLFPNSGPKSGGPTTTSDGDKKATPGAASGGAGRAPVVASSAAKVFAHNNPGAARGERRGRARVDSQARPAEFFKPNKSFIPQKFLGKSQTDWASMSVHGINEPALRQRLESKCIGQDAVDKVTEEFKVHDKLTADDHEKLHAMVQQAHTLHSNHDDKGAEEIYEKVLEADPLDFECLTNLGKISYSGGDLPRARELFEKAVVVKPEKEKTMYHLAIVLYDQRETDRAKILFEQVVQGYTGPKSGIIGESADTNTFHNSIAMLGLIHQSVLQDVDKAEKLYQVVLKQNGDHVLTLDHKCALYALKGEADEAAKLHRKVCGLDPNHTRKVCPYLDSLFPPQQRLMHPVQPLTTRLENESEKFAVGSRKKHWTNHPWRSFVKKLTRMFGGGGAPPPDAAEGGGPKPKPVVV